jgi:hypothetical protein
LQSPAPIFRCTLLAVLLCDDLPIAVAILASVLDRPTADSMGTRLATTFPTRDCARQDINNCTNRQHQSNVDDSGFEGGHTPRNLLGVQRILRLLSREDGGIAAEPIRLYCHATVAAQGRARDGAAHVA